MYGRCRGVSCRIALEPPPVSSPDTESMMGGPAPWRRCPHAALSLCPVPRYFLQPRDNGSKSLKPGDLGSLRLNVVYTEDHVFSSDYYSPLRDLLLKSADVEVLLCQVHPPVAQSTCKPLTHPIPAQLLFLTSPIFCVPWLPPTLPGPPSLSTWGPTPGLPSPGW